MWNSLARRKTVYHKMFQNFPRFMLDLSWKLHDNPFMRFPLLSIRPREQISMQFSVKIQISLFKKIYLKCLLQNVSHLCWSQSVNHVHSFSTIALQFSATTWRWHQRHCCLWPSSWSPKPVSLAAKTIPYRRDEVRHGNWRNYGMFLKSMNQNCEHAELFKR